jgi:hypothetical protein
MPAQAGIQVFNFMGSGCAHYYPEQNQGGIANCLKAP